MKKVFTIFSILFAFALTANANSVNRDFDKLFQNSYNLSHSIGIFLKETFNPYYGNGYFNAYNCIVDKIIVLMAKGTNRLTGIDTNYIIEALNGRNPPPFQSQLGCIKDGLVKMRQEVKDARNISIQFKNDYVIPPSTRKTCAEYLNFTLPAHYELFDVYIPATRGLNDYNEKFKSINMLDLYKEFLNSKVKCDLSGTGTVSSDYGHVDQQEGIDYYLGLSKHLSYPLTCVSEHFDKQISGIKAVYAEMLMYN